MAQGGEFGYEDRAHDWLLDHDDDDDDDQEVNRTRTFVPDTASTPYHDGEQHEMQTMHEQSGLPDTSYEETPFLGSPFLSPEDMKIKVGRALDFIKSKFSRVDFAKLGPIGFSKKGARADIVLFWPKTGETKIFKKDGSFQKSFIGRFSKSLGPSAEEILAQDRNTAIEQRQRLEGAERQLRESEKIDEQIDEESQEIQNLSSLTERVDAQIAARQEEQGSNLENEIELNRLKQLKKIMKKIWRLRK